MKCLYVTLLVTCNLVAMEKKPELKRSPSSPNLSAKVEKKNGVKRAESLTHIIYRRDGIETQQNKNTHTIRTTAKNGKLALHGNGFYKSLEYIFDGQLQMPTPPTDNPDSTEKSKQDKKPKKEKKHKKDKKH